MIAFALGYTLWIFESFMNKGISCGNKLASEPTSPDLVNHHLRDYQDDKTNHVHSVEPAGPGEGGAGRSGGSGRGGSGGAGGSGPNGPNFGESDDGKPQPNIRRIIHETIQKRTTDEVSKGLITKTILSVGLVRKNIIFNLNASDSDDPKPEPNIRRVIDEKIPERIKLEFSKGVLTE